MKGLVTLDTWIEINYEEPRPSSYTARRWVKNGNITPRPQKHGRSYYLRPDAQYRKVAPGSRTRLIDVLHGQTQNQPA